MTSAEFYELLRPLTRKVRNLVTRATVKAANAAAKLQALQVKGLGGVASDDDVEHFEPYGFTSRPLAGAEALVVNLGGSADVPVVIAVADRRYRVVPADEGGVAVYNDQGHKIELRADRIIVEAPLVEIQAQGDVLTAADGVLTGQAIDPFTGATHFALGNASTQTLAKK